ncbi:hypothetical protein STCU_08549 [Strigomonas culicis]|uniref:Uncharacterized protein n=1 Tax=Strigomonas culicis TaxID=28005 RepID=S9TSQ4_9TRYP|nr:hypothetical protein STCU_08549 [Strigomonas culicis]|eukprot:EPY21432.1 hypothetical protein STCU_08549 [Strigomonas culicis]
MVLQLQRKHYFSTFLNMQVTLPGYKEGDALVVENPPASSQEDGAELAKPIVRIKQFDGQQGMLVSCGLQLSQARPQADITHLLVDLPGFVSLFPAHQSNNNNSNSYTNNNNNRRNPQYKPGGAIARNYRIVFQNKRYLFQAKHLLDQFELEGNLRVYLKLNENLAKEEEAFRQEEEEKGGLGSSHPISVIDDVNASALDF